MNNQGTQMRKAQLVIRHVLFIAITFLFCNKTYAQEKIDGKYCINFLLGDNYDCIEFTNNSFYRTIGADLGNDYYGKGLYQLKSNLLILNYNKTILKNPSGYYRYKVWKNKSDSIQLTFKIKSIQDIPIPYALIAIHKERSTTEANGKGTAELWSTKSNVKKEIRISFLGYEEIKISVSGNLNYHFEVYLKESDSLGTPIKNQQDTLKIKEVNKDYFIVLNKYGKEILWNKEE